MKVLYIGGTGEISYPCLHASVATGQECSIFNRGRSTQPLPPGVRQIVGDLADLPTYQKLGREHFDVVCQFTAYSIADIQRDLAVFSGHTGQYVFISTASAYQKPFAHLRVTEDTPLGNAYWPYSQAKAEMENLLWSLPDNNQLPLTVVRPSHTYRRRFPGSYISGDNHAWRLLNNKPIICHGDGTSLWTLTHANDFAGPFSRLLGNPKAMGQAFHVVTDTIFTWNHIYQTMAQALGVKAQIVHVSSDTLARYKSDWAGPLLGEKSWSTLFDTSKLVAATGPLPTPTPLAQGFAQVVEHFHTRMKETGPDMAVQTLIDRIVQEQTAVHC